MNSEIIFLSLSEMLRCVAFKQNIAENTKI